MQDYIPRKIDINEQLPTVIVKQFDNLSRFIHVQILDNDLPDISDDEKYFNLENSTARLYVQPKGDDSGTNVAYIDGEVADDEQGIVTFLLPSSVTETAGNYDGEIWIYGAESSHSIISTKPFDFVVEKSIRNNTAIEGTSKFTALDNVLSNNDLMRAQMAELIASPAGTGGDVGTELRDIRIGYDNTEYETAGDAVRSQVASVKSVLTSKIENVDNNFLHFNYFNKNDLTPEYTYLTVNAATLNSLTEGSSQYRMSNIIPTSGNKKWYIDYNSAGVSTMVFYGDINYNVISYETLSKSSTNGEPTEFTTPISCNFMRIRFIDANKSDTFMVVDDPILIEEYRNYNEVSIPGLMLTNEQLLNRKIQDKSLKIVLVSDLHFGKTDKKGISSNDRAAYLIEKLNEIQRESSIDFVIFNGDVCNYTNSDININAFMNDFGRQFNRPVFPVVGNHDVYSTQKFEKVWGVKRRYTFESDDFFFIVNDSYYTETIDEMTGEYLYSGLDYTWLESQLQAASVLNKIPIIISHQIEPSAEHDRQFNQMCLNYNVPLVIRGHTHIVSNVVNPASGALIAIAGAWVTDSVNPNTYGLTIFRFNTETGYFQSENRQYNYADDSYTATIANIFKSQKAISADYQIDKIPIPSDFN